VWLVYRLLFVCSEYDTMDDGPQATAEGAVGMIEPSGAPWSVPRSYLKLCQGFGAALTARLTPEPGDWLWGPDGLELVTSATRQRQPGEVLVPRLERLLRLLEAEAPVFVLDYQRGDYACLAFDQEGRSLANVVAPCPAEAVLRAILFIRAERAANDRSRQ